MKLSTTAQKTDSQISLRMNLLQRVMIFNTALCLRRKSFKQVREILIQVSGKKKWTSMYTASQYGLDTWGGRVLASVPQERRGLILYF